MTTLPRTRAAVPAPAVVIGDMRPQLTLGVLLALAASATSLCWASPAHAGSHIGVIVTGDSWIQPQLVAHIESWLSQHGHTLVPSPLPPDALDALNQCFVDSNEICAHAIVEQRASATAVLHVRASSKPHRTGAPDITLTAYWFDKGHDPARANQTCPRCTDPSLRTTADGLLKKLLGVEDLGHAKLKSAPPGARITIDGQPIGVTPLDWDLPPGKHTIRIDKPGYQSQSQDLAIESNQSKLLVMTLQEEGNHDSGTGLPRWVPLAATLTGGAALVTGGILFAIDEDEVFVNPTERYFRDTASLGVGLAIGGTVVASLGAYWLWFRSSETTSAPVASFTSDTAYVGWHGRF